MRSCAAHVRIIVTSALSIRFTRTLAVFPPDVVKPTDGLVLAGVVGEAVAAGQPLDLAPWGRLYAAVMERHALLIGEVAKQSGLSRKALRLYEARGILPPSRRSSSGYRTYPRDVVGVLHFVTQARRLGLTLSEIGSIVALRCAKPGPCVQVRALLERKVTELDNVRRELRRILDSWEASSQLHGVVCQHIEGEG